MRTERVCPTQDPLPYRMAPDAFVGGDLTREEGGGGMRRVVAIANGRGGVGKPPLTAGLAGQFAAAGLRVLVVDTDPQGNMGRDLGYGLQDGSSLGLAI